MGMQWEFGVGVREILIYERLVIWWKREDGDSRVKKGGHCGNGTVRRVFGNEESLRHGKRFRAMVDLVWLCPRSIRLPMLVVVRNWYRDWRSWDAAKWVVLLAVIICKCHDTVAAFRLPSTCSIIRTDNIRTQILLFHHWDFSISSGTRKTNDARETAYKLQTVLPSTLSASSSVDYVLGWIESLIIISSFYSTIIAVLNSESTSVEMNLQFLF